MALETDFDPFGTGEPCRYWKIGSVHLDHLQCHATLWVHGWATSERRAAGNAPAATVQIGLGRENFPEGLHRATTEGLYRAFKQRAACEADDGSRGLERAIESIGAVHFANAIDC
jgi:hypothetical protein